MNFFKNIFIIFFLLFSFNIVLADTDQSTKEVVEKAKEITKDLENKIEQPTRVNFRQGRSNSWT